MSEVLVDFFLEDIEFVFLYSSLLSKFSVDIYI